MDLFEFQGKHLLAEAGLACPRGRVASTAVAAERVAAELGEQVVVKAQVRCGGRGKAGGVLRVPAGDVVAATERILGMRIGEHTVRRVLVEEALSVRRELYAALLLDRDAKDVVAMLSAQGGVEIERLAAERPDALVSVHIDPLLGYSAFHGRQLAYGAGLSGGLAGELVEVFRRLWTVFERYDATLVEINPLAICEDERLVCLDAKLSIDGNAAFAHSEFTSAEADEIDDPQERAAHEQGLTYVKLGGEIGVLGNGAGLVMSTLDLLAAAGGRPANFLDVGGGARAQEITTALELICSDAKVKVVLFNVFGGITRCDEVAHGLLAAVEQLDLKVPIVVRLDGTNRDEGRQVLAAAALANVHIEQSMETAAVRAVALAHRPEHERGDT